MLTHYRLWWRRLQNVDGAEDQMIGGVSHTWKVQPHLSLRPETSREGGKLPQETRKTNQGMMGHQYLQQQKWYL